MKKPYTIIYTIICILLFLGILKWGHYLYVNGYISTCSRKEGLTEFEKYSEKVVPYPKDAVIDYNDLNSPLYSHNVDLPFNALYSCKNFCGPQSQCAITRTQCTSDIDCYGCQPQNQQPTPCNTEDIPGYEDSGKLGQNQGLTYSELTTGYQNHGMDFAEVYPGSKASEIVPSYLGVDTWTPSFNTGLKLYNENREFSHGPADDEKAFIPKYPTTVTATGLFYNTGPTPSNAYLS
jgi:hypothetical protein